MNSLAQIDDWQVEFAAAGVSTGETVVATRGDASRPVRLASVSKPVTALATLVAVEEGALELDEDAGPPGATVRHLLAHASGLPFEGTSAIAPPGRRRIYSNSGFAALGDHLTARAGIRFADYVRDAVCEPLALSLDPAGHPGAGMHANLEDVLAIGRELLRPRLLAAETHRELVAVQFPGLDGVLPEFGRFEPLDWGLGVELFQKKQPHWSGASLSTAAFGHYGGSGTFLWVDPDRDLTCAVLTTTPFGAWAKTAWPRLSDAVIAELD